LCASGVLIATTQLFLLNSIAASPMRWWWVEKTPPVRRALHRIYEEIVVQDLNLSPRMTRYRRERWQTPEGETVIADLDAGIVGGYGLNLHRFILALHFSGQVTCERIVALLNGMGMVISKRQVVRLLTTKLETFRAEDEAVLRAGLGGAYVTVDEPRRRERLYYADRLRELRP
jgi:hypothetical protein